MPPGTRVLERPRPPRRSYDGSLADPATPLWGAAALWGAAQGLARHAPMWRDLGRPQRRHWELLAAADEVEAWVIAWPPGGAIEFHDHGASSGAVVVTAGQLTESEVFAGPDGSAVVHTRELVAGASVVFGTGHLHDLVNRSESPAVSVHVYAPRLTEMTFYDITDGRLAVGRTVRYQLGAAVP
jgi:predicted metal-dependent enzyme (double-stranded beta helix superfamily)